MQAHSQWIQFRHRVHVFLHPRQKNAFIWSIAKHGRLLDVGCGNDSPELTKRLRPDLHYSGIDVCDYEHMHPPTEFADVYKLASPEGFVDGIRSFSGKFDAVVSAHNLEHCLDQEGALTAMLNAVDRNGTIYLAFPCSESTGFPSRSGTLNFYDDNTHTKPPDFQSILCALNDAGFHVTFARKQYRPWIRTLIGRLMEPSSARQRKVKRGTWELYGFESIIWARKQ